LHTSASRTRLTPADPSTDHPSFDEAAYLSALSADTKHLYRALRAVYGPNAARHVIRTLVRECGGADWYIESPRMRFETAETRRALALFRKGHARADVQAETGLTDEVLQIVEGKFMVAG
jgi:hypothetical protein